ncbi:hypothetical protein COU37_05150 [Candidatus Micrarchaeota archaeon CG10_big_fil_rev_8_21_14_0_10_45_29]|nr:MAG: hypothetical protein COU37_05150 [Candidatus Micrarchaeota archaeon CG10_big_fil_rev_8_21_14_0_10_45_29]
MEFDYSYSKLTDDELEVLIFLLREKRAMSLFEILRLIREKAKRAISEPALANKLYGLVYNKIVEKQDRSQKDAMRKSIFYSLSPDFMRQWTARKCYFELLLGKENVRPEKFLDEKLIKFYRLDD